MSDTISARESVFQFPWERAVGRDTREHGQYDALTTELQAARAREEAWLREKSEFLQRQGLLTQEFEHRLVNSLQIIVSLLSLQSRTAGPEAAAQLTIAANRVASFGRVHRGLHLLDHQESVHFKQYLQHLCDDLSELLFEGGDRTHDCSRGRGDRSTHCVRYSARLYRQRADHQFSETCQEQHYGSIGGNADNRSLAIGVG